MQFDDYEDLKKGLKELPITWYPALLVIILEIIIEKKVFTGRFALLGLVRTILDKAGYR
jgi:hypothetical protein